MNEQGLLQAARKLINDPVEHNRINSTFSSIIETCKKHYVSILPNNINRVMDGGTANSFSQRDETKTSDIDKLHIQEIVRQFAQVVQMLLQICVLSGDDECRSKSYNLLEKARRLMLQDVQQMEQILYNKTGRPVSHSKVNFTDFLPYAHRREPIVVDLPPQMSMYQEPLLYLMFHKVAHFQLIHPLGPAEPQAEGMERLRSFSPFVNPLYLPVVDEHTVRLNKGKFSALDDRLFLMGLVRHSSKNIEKIHELYVPARTEQQLKNRIKNLCAKSSYNEIKQYKQNEYLPLTQHEFKRFAEGLARFGPRFEVISKYMSLRTAHFLEEEYNESDRLRKKRERENFPSHPVRERLQQCQAELAGSMQAEQNMEHSQIMSQSYFLALRNNENSQRSMPQNTPERRERYKMIGLETFEYDEL